MDDKYDWEVWDPTSLSFRHHMLAGIAAGVAEHIVFFPIDTLRVWYCMKGISKRRICKPFRRPYIIPLK